MPDANSTTTTPGPRERLRRLHRLVNTYYRVHAHLPGRPVMPLGLQNILAVILLPCGQPHPEEASCPDCSRLLSATLDAIRAESALVIWPAVAEALAQISQPPSGPRQPGAARQSAVSRAAALLPRLSAYHASLHRPCERCGSLLWWELPDRRFRCLLCAPPPRFSAELRASIVETCHL